MEKKFLSLFIILFLCVLTSLPISADYVEQKAGPLSKRFLQWQRLHDDNMYQAFKMLDASGENENPTGYRPSPVDTTHLSKNLPKKRYIDIPKKFDLRDTDRVTEIKNQAPYGTCWVFGAFASMESNFITQNAGTDPDLSELHQAWFAYKDSKPGNSFMLRSVHSGKNPVLDLGGNSIMTVAYMTGMIGPVAEKSLNYDKALQMDYLSQNSSDYKPLSLRLKETYVLGDLSPEMSDADRAEMITQMKALIIDNGALAMSYYAGEGATSPDSSTTAYFDNSHEDYFDHTVAIIGWDDDFDRTRFSTDPTRLPKNNGAWLVRNSWGRNWGNNGYFYISYEQFISEVISYIVKQENRDGIKYYGHDALGYINDFSAVWAANVFKTEAWNEGLSEIGFYTTDHNTSLDIYVFDLGSDTPLRPVPDDVNSPLLSKKGIEIDYSGYHTIELDKIIPLSKDHYFSVIVRSNSNYEYPTAYEAFLQDFSEPVINPGESWFAVNNSEVLADDMIWADGANEVTLAGNSIPTPMNACIKAFTVPLEVEGIAVNSENFRDDNFRVYVTENFDRDKNNYLSDEEISEVKSINISNKNITDLKGIEFFVNLEELDCSKNLIQSLDLIYNKEIKSLNCSENKLKVLNLSSTKITANNLICSQQTINDNVKVSETFSDGEYKYRFEVIDLLSDKFAGKVRKIQGLDNLSSNIDTVFDTDIAEFKSKPSKLTYYYDTGIQNALMPVNANVSNELKLIKPVIKTAYKLPEGKISELYDYDLIAKSSSAPATWEKTSGDLPEGLVFSNAGKISGTPRYAGTFRFEASSKNDIGTTSRDFSIKILNETPVISTNKVSESVTAGEGDFNIVLTAVKGTNFKWIRGGNLPYGVNFESNDSTFKITGTPALHEAGKVFTYYVTASNDADFARQAITLNVKNIAPVFGNLASNYSLNTKKSVRIVLNTTKGTNLKWTAAGNLPTGLTGKIYGSIAFKIEGLPDESAIGKEFAYTLTVSNDVGYESKRFVFTVSNGDNKSNIPENKRMSMKDYLDSLTDEELANITSLVIPEYVKDLSGLNEIEGLPTLDFSKNGLITEVNLDGNDSIENLILSQNSGVKVLNISKSKVKRIEAEDSNLEEINIEGSEFIEYINICNTYVKSVNAKDCYNLKILLCSDSEISSIILDGCSSLKEFECDGNRLSQLNLEEFDLTEFACFGQEVEDWKFSRVMYLSDYIPEKISNVQGYDAGGHRIPTTYESDAGKIIFPSIPRSITYDYNTGFENEIMDVTVLDESLNNSEEDEEDTDSSGGGCVIGFNFAVLAFITFRKK